MSQVPPLGNGNMGPMMRPGIPSYPGTPQINAMPIMQYNPTFDGLFNHGLTTNPYANSLFEDVNTMQTQIYGSNGLGYPPQMQAGMQAQPGLGAQGGFTAPA